MEEIKPMQLDELIDILTNAVKIYGNRPVFVNINDKRYIINDLKLTAKGKTFELILN